VASTEKIRADFDRLAQFAGDGWDHNSHYHPFLLRHMPARMETALDLGCGAGTFARQLAKRAEQVVAIDLSSEMIRIARERSTGIANIDYRVMDVMTWDMPPAAFDCIASIATLHHLPIEPILEKMKAALRPGGVMLVLDLFHERVTQHLPQNVLAVIISRMLKTGHHGRSKPSPEANAAWAAHGETDIYLTIPQVREACMNVLPGAQVTRHLLWRYSILWKKPTSISL
jgi:2-polyprenyl-3-methyl-5-hydroxy-6-metoxy-1,4-benzoquinol methylase